MNCPSSLATAAESFQPEPGGVKEQAAWVIVRRHEFAVMNSPPGGYKSCDRPGFVVISPA